MPTRLASKLLLIGWDAADWKVIDRLLARGLLPNLRRLVEGGVRANLASLGPTRAPIQWGSNAPGITAHDHVELHFVEPDRAGPALRVVPSTPRGEKALWNILSQSVMSTPVVNCYATHPAEPIRGVMVSNLF